MPAVVVDDISVLPRIPEPDPAIARERAVRSVTDAPQRLRRGGVPGPSRLRRRRARGPRPVRPPRPDGRGRVRPRRGEGHAVAPASRLRDRHLHDRRRSSSTATRTAAAGVITNGDTQWMTAGSGILHIEKPPEALVRSGGLFHGFQLWVNLPADQKWAAAALPGHPRAARSALALVAGWRRARPGHRRRRRRSRRSGLDLQPDDPGPRHAQPRRPPDAAVAARLQRPRLRHGGAGDASAAKAGRSAWASSPCSGRAMP